MVSKFWMLVTVAVIAASLIAGCAGEVKTYTDSAQVISIDSNQEFIIALDSNHSTGYSWQESYDETILKLVEKSYQQDKRAKEIKVGVGGADHFRFKALKTGETKITMTYKQPWAATATDQKVFTVKIK